MDVTKHYGTQYCMLSATHYAKCYGASSWPAADVNPMSNYLLHVAIGMCMLGTMELKQSILNLFNTGPVTQSPCAYTKELHG
jgi:hypothetical protein